MEWSGAEQLKAVGGRMLSDVMNDPPPGFLFENCFRDRSITVLVAPPHRGKTLLMMDMAICLEMERPLFGQFAPIPGRRSFWLGCDAPSWDYGLQARKLFIGHGVAPEERHMYEIPGVWKSGPKITDPKLVEWLQEWKRATGTDVLFVDTHRATHNADENDSREMEKVWDILKGLRDSGWCLIVAHHTSKPTEVLQEDVHAGRGSTVIGASADFIWILNKKSRRDPRVKAQCVKGRGAADDTDPFSFFDITPTESTEMLDGRPLYGLKLIASAEDFMRELRKQFDTGQKTRSELSTGMRVACPQLTETLTDEQLYRQIDNRMVELRRLGEIIVVSRGVWAKKGA